MQQQPNEVNTWAPAWWHNRRDDVRRADRTISVIGNHPPFCLLCQRPIEWGPEARDRHHLEHMADLDAWLDDRDEPTGPKPDSLRRSKDRRWRHSTQAEQAEAFGRDPYLYAVERVDVDSIKRVRPVLRRRLRHPKAETEARIHELHAQGLMRSVIADRLMLSEDYVRRVLKRVENGVSQNGPSKPLSMRALSDLAVPDGGLPDPGEKPGMSGGDV